MKPTSAFVGVSWQFRIESSSIALWAIESIGISGGFLSDLSLRLPKGLICVIGPRGSGKSILAEAIRLVLGGVPSGAPKPRLDLLRANLAASVFSLTTTPGTDRGGFTVRRTYGQTAIMTAADARLATTVDLDRGTFLPIDAYSSLDIKGIADESLGSKRRTLLDDLPVPSRYHGPFDPRMLSQQAGFSKIGLDSVFI